MIQDQAFTRNRKVSLPLIARLTASLSSQSIRQQTQAFRKNRHISFTPSTFCQARQKFDHSLFKQACLNFASHLATQSSLYKGKYRLIGVDGSCLPILPNPDKPQNLVMRNGSPHHELHINAAFDLINKYYLDYEIQSACDKNENRVALRFVKRYNYLGILVIIGDRLYFSYELATQIQNAGYKFLFRMKLCNCSSLLGADHPLDQEIDLESSRILINTQKAITKNQPEVSKYVPKGSVSLITSDQPELNFPYSDHYRNRML